jgi:DNA-directed RNA polymerase subunit RPC12/RpoP
MLIVEQEINLKITCTECGQKHLVPPSFCMAFCVRCGHKIVDKHKTADVQASTTKESE